MYTFKCGNSQLSDMTRRMIMPICSCPFHRDRMPKIEYDDEMPFGPKHYGSRGSLPGSSQQCQFPSYIDKLSPFCRVRNFTNYGKEPRCSLKMNVAMYGEAVVTTTKWGSWKIAKFGHCA